jgi:hypothetical protein
MWAATSEAHLGDMFTHPEFTIALANERTQSFVEEASRNRLARAMPHLRGAAPL